MTFTGRCDLHGFNPVAPLKLKWVLDMPMVGTLSPRVQPRGPIEARSALDAEAAFWRHLHGFNPVAPLKRQVVPIRPTPAPHISTGSTPWPH